MRSRSGSWTAVSDSSVQVLREPALAIEAQTFAVAGQWNVKDFFAFRLTFLLSAEIIRVSAVITEYINS